MAFDYTEYEYLPVCIDGCGAITDWLNSKEMAREACENHARTNHHKWEVRERIRS